MGFSVPAQPPWTPSGLLRFYRGRLRQHLKGQGLQGAWPWTRENNDPLLHRPRCCKRWAPVWGAHREISVALLMEAVAWLSTSCLCSCD